MKFKPLSTKAVGKEGKFYLLCEVPSNNVNELNKLCNKDCDKTIEVKEYKGNRSLSANSYLWVLLGGLSNKLHIPKGDLYIKKIKDYGVFTQFCIEDKALTDLIIKWDSANTSVSHSESLCEVTSNFRSKGKLWHEVTCHFGTSGYNTNEFSKLLQGVIQDCEDVGISTLSDSEVEQLIKNYTGGM